MSEKPYLGEVPMFEKPYLGEVPMSTEGGSCSLPHVAEALDLIGCCRHLEGQLLHEVARQHISRALIPLPGCTIPPRKQACQEGETLESYTIESLIKSKLKMEL